jgi:hypothetical protein
MKSILISLLVSTAIISPAMAVWSQEDKATKAENIENERMCSIYIKKVKKYKETMRDDEHAHVTLANYIRLQIKYCEITDYNQVK